MPAEAGEPLLIEFKTRWTNSDPATCAGLNAMLEALNALKAAVEKLQGAKKAVAANAGEYVVIGLDVNGLPGRYESYGKNLEAL